ncbi:MAG TPA: beta-ketoacyl synthase N-terminal-like domain-containing protein [Conexibacter sp.]
MSTSAIAGAAALTAAELERPDVAELLAGERLRSVSVESRLLLAAARMALRDARARADAPATDPDGLGVVVATRHAGLQDYVELYREGTDAERPRVRPAKGPQAGLTAPAAEVSIRLPAAGPNATLCNGAVGGLDALRYASDRLAAGDADAMLVCELELAPAALRRDADAAPEQQRAAVLVLERDEALRAPRTHVLAVATAFSPDDDADEALARASAEALAEAGVGAADPLPVSRLGAVARLVAAAAGGAHGPRLVTAHEAGAAGAAVVMSEPEEGR